VFVGECEFGSSLVYLLFWGRMGGGGEVGQKLIC